MRAARRGASRPRAPTPEGSRRARGARALTLLATWAGLSSAGRAEAQVGPVGSTPLDARTAALASAVTADASGFASTVHNPAGLSRSPGFEVGLGYAYREHALHSDGVESRVAGAHRLVAGIAAVGRVFELPAGFGISVQLPVAAAARRAAGARWERYDPRADVVQLATGVGLRPHPSLELGVGLVHLVGVSDRAAARDLGADVATRTEPLLGARSLPQAGLSFALSERARLGLVLRGGAELRVRWADPSRSGPSRVAVGASRDPSSLAAFVPPELVVGSSTQVSERIRLSLDIAYLGYASLEGPFVDRGGSSPAPRRGPLDDRVVPRVGLEWLMPGFESSGLRVPVRVGYALERSPLRDDVPLDDVVDTTRHTAAVGCGVDVPGSGLSFAVHASFGMLPERLRIVGDPRTLLSADGTQADLGLSVSSRIP